VRSRDLGFNPQTGVQTIYHSDGYGEEYTVEMKQDVEPFAEDNLLQRNAASSSWKGNWHRVASVPFSVYAILAKQPDPFVDATGKVLDKARYRKWLNSSDALPWRTKRGRV
jgi:hypothetical protein